MKDCICLICALIAALALAGCASNGAPDRDTVVASSEVDHEAALRDLVAAEVEKGRAGAGERDARLLFSKPYFYKEYWEFPGEETVFSADFTEKESLSIPLTAEVEVEKVRFATRARRDRGEARDDHDYLRSTGIEQASYELRHGQWRRIGSLFLAERTEELRDGEWKQIEERKQVVVLDDEEPQGFFRRLMFWR